MKMNTLDKVVYFLLVLGGIYWGTIGAFNYNVLDKVFGVDSSISRVIYIIVGLAALYGIYTMVSMVVKVEDTPKK